MGWLSDSLDKLAHAPTLGYADDQSPATEPTAVAALALGGHDRRESAMVAARWLLEQQARDGSVGIRQGETEPRWPTSLAMLVWCRCREEAASADAARLSSAIEHGQAWLMSCVGHTMAHDSGLGHDTQLAAWPWVEGTHSWIEPTALSVMALKAIGQTQHARTREAVRLLLDRLLPDGGCNYGNTVVLGQVLRPHLLPTGLALTALAGESDPTGRVGKSMRFVQGQLSPRTPVMSLAWSVIGLATHGALPADAEQWLEAAAQRAARGQGKRWWMALLCLAALRDQALPRAPRATSGESSGKRGGR